MIMPKEEELFSENERPNPRKQKLTILKPTKRRVENKNLNKDKILQKGVHLGGLKPSPLLGHQITAPVRHEVFLPYCDKPRPPHLQTTKSFSISFNSPTSRCPFTTQFKTPQPPYGTVMESEIDCFFQIPQIFTWADRATPSLQFTTSNPHTT